ncbi:MAG: glycosyltransferase [Planctomycetota bacterium]
MSRTRIHMSGVVVCQDNEDTIEAVLASLAPHCQEIVVVDGGSRDGTLERALRCPLTRLYERPFPGSIADQKNFAFAQCQGDWIFVLDTDEVLAPVSPAAVHRLTRLPIVNWLSLPRYWVVPHQGGLGYLSEKPFYKDRQLRIFRNEPCFRYDGSKSAIHHEVHERRGMGFAITKPHIYHFDLLLRSRAEREAKVARYRALDPEGERLHRMYLYEDWDTPILPLPAPPPVLLHELAAAHQA